MWARTTFPASSVQYASLTHINHAFAWPNSNGSITSYDSVVDTALINTTHRAGRKILLSFGGAGATQTANFAIVAADSARRKTFNDNLVSRLTSYHYDGADLDWEGPASLADKANEVTLVKEMRAALRAADTTLLLTMAIGASGWSGQWRDFASLKIYVDWFNAMEYDFHGSWSSIAGHNAPLYVGTNPLNDPDYFSIDESILYLSVVRAIPKDKIALGLPFYGKLFGTSTLYSSFTGEQDLAYRDIKIALQTGSWTYVWDSGSQAPYYTSASPAKLITLDDSTSIALKCQYVKTKGLSGVMIWEISQDVIGQSQPLLDVVGAQMMTPTLVSNPHSEFMPSRFGLSDNYPNPFNPSTTIRFSLPSAAMVSIRVFDVLGREIVTILNEHREAGTGSVRFDASSYALVSGVYFYRIDAGSFLQTKKMILTR